MSDPTTPDRPRRPAPMPVTVLETSWLSPTMVRVIFGGDHLARFRPSPYCDSYVKLTFPCPGVHYPEPLDVGQIHASFPQSQWPVVRTYTVRNWDAERCVLTIDFVVHGDSGIAGPWAAAAQPGDRIFLQGPGGAYSPDDRAGWHLLVGDESALPAIAVAVDRLGALARGHVLIEVPGPDSVTPFEAPAGIAVSWVHKGRQRGERLVQAVRSLEIPDVAVHAFVHGEAGFVAELRRMLRVDLKLPRDRLSMSGYWRLGANEEGWRAAKTSWNAAAEEIERRAGVA